MIEISACRSGRSRREDIKVHRRSSSLLAAVGALDRIPITSPVQTIIDLVSEKGPRDLLRIVNEADQLDVIHADDLRAGAFSLWPETDGLRYHRTPYAQAKDAKRDQAHTAAGFTRLRFSHWQVRYEAAYVRGILARTVAQLSGRSIRGAPRSGRRVR